MSDFSLRLGPVSQPALSSVTSRFNYTTGETRNDETAITPKWLRATMRSLSGCILNASWSRICYFCQSQTNPLFYNTEKNRSGHMSRFWAEMILEPADVHGGRRLNLSFHKWIKSKQKVITNIYLLYSLLTSIRCFGYAAKVRIKYSSFTGIMAALEHSLTTRSRLGVLVSHRKCY